MITVTVAMRAQRQHLTGGGQALVDHDGVFGHRFHHLQREVVRVDRRARAVLRDLFNQARASALQFLDASAEMPCFARAVSAEPPADCSAGTSARNVSFTSALMAISAP